MEVVSVTAPLVMRFKRTSVRDGIGVVYVMQREQQCVCAHRRRWESYMSCDGSSQCCGKRAFPDRVLDQAASEGGACRRPKATFLLTGKKI